MGSLRPSVTYRHGSIAAALQSFAPSQPYFRTAWRHARMYSRSCRSLGADCMILPEPLWLKPSNLLLGLRSCLMHGCQKLTAKSKRVFGQAVCPAKAGMSSGRQSRRGNSQEPRSLGCIRGGNEADEANRQSRPWGGERVTGPQRK